MKKKESLAAAIRAQQKWIEDHGGTLSGYIERYGRPGEPKCLGNGGFAIYEADVAELHRLENMQRRGK